MSRGVIADIALSILMAPVSMLTQTINLFGILMGRKSSWSGQIRDRDGMAMTSAIWLFKYHIMLGGALTALAIRGGTSVGWIIPVVAGLVLAPVLAAFTARKDLGHKAEQSGLFQVAEPWWRAQSYRPPHYPEQVRGRPPLQQAVANDR
jgi:membrane glycosyltransferase